jgi:hypothetical protein
MIIEICGPSGGGKTHLMRALMARHGVIAHRDDRARDVGYSGTLPGGETFYVIGDYRRVCGGAEAMTQAAIKECIWTADRRYDHVLFEGLMASTCFGTYAALFRERAAGRHCFAFIRPPYEVCAERVAARRAARGDARPLKNSSGYFHSYIGNAIGRAQAMGAPHVVLPLAPAAARARGVVCGGAPAADQQEDGPRRVSGNGARLRAHSRPGAFSSFNRSRCAAHFVSASRFSSKYSWTS